MIEQGTEERIVRLELKYCEVCGGLLLKRTGEAVVYCGSCAKKMAELPERKLNFEKKAAKKVEVQAPREEEVSGEVPPKKSPRPEMEFRMRTVGESRCSTRVPGTEQRRLG